MMNSAPAVVGASDGLAAFMSIIAKKGTRSCLGAGCGGCGLAESDYWQELSQSIDFTSESSS